MKTVTLEIDEHIYPSREKLDTLVAESLITCS